MKLFVDHKPQVCAECLFVGFFTIIIGGCPSFAFGCTLLHKPLNKMDDAAIGKFTECPLEVACASVDLT